MESGAGVVSGAGAGVVSGTGAGVAAGASVGAGVVVLSAVLLQATSMQVAAERTRSLKALFFIGIPLFALIQSAG